MCCGESWTDALNCNQLDGAGRRTGKMVQGDDDFSEVLVRQAITTKIYLTAYLGQRNNLMNFVVHKWQESVNFWTVDEWAGTWFYPASRLSAVAGAWKKFFVHFFPFSVLLCTLCLTITNLWIVVRVSLWLYNRLTILTYISYWELLRRFWWYFVWTFRH
jgi:hypothetical protein